MAQNGQIHFKNLAANAARFLVCLTILGDYAKKGLKQEIYMKQHIFSIKLELQMILLSIGDLPDTDACSHRCSCKKVFFKYTANLKENTHAELGL